MIIGRQTPLIKIWTKHYLFCVSLHTQTHSPSITFICSMLIFTRYRPTNNLTCTRSTFAFVFSYWLVLTHKCPMDRIRSLPYRYSSNRVMNLVVFLHISILSSKIRVTRRIGCSTTVSDTRIFSPGVRNNLHLLIIFFVLIGKRICFLS